MAAGFAALAAVFLPGVTAALEAVERWEPEIRAFEVADRAAPPAKGGIVFTGSSSVRMWDLAAAFPGAGALNRGFGGSQLADAVAYAGRIVAPYEPRLVVLYAGDNDIAAGKKAEEVAADFTRFAKLVHGWLPKTVILYLSIKPSPQRWALSPEMKKANRLIQAAVKKGKRLKYLDVSTPLLGKDGTPRPELYLADGLHLSPEGYAVWNGLLAPLLRPDERR